MSRNPIDLLPAQLTMGAVTLKTDNLPRLRNYYQQAIGLVEVSESPNGVVLGRGTTPLVVIEYAAGLKLPSQSEAGLFHTALLFENHADLAATVYRALSHDRTRFVGSSDHLVSEAFYFQDPDNNGIELYVDRPRDQWTWTDGQVAMDTAYLPWDRFIGQHLTEESVSHMESATADLGHVHLQVGDVDMARTFYVGVMGFEETASVGNSALFVATGGYHHHMAMNTWNSTGAGPRRNTLGLGSVEISIPAGDELASLESRLQSSGYPTRRTEHGLETQDPWNTTLIVSESDA